MKLVLFNFNILLVAFAWIVIPTAALPPKRRYNKPNSRDNNPNSRDRYKPKSRDDLQSAVDACLRMSLTTPKPSQELFELDGMCIVSMQDCECLPCCQLVMQMFCDYWTRYDLLFFLLCHADCVWWPCHLCTFLNKAGNLQCGMCGTLKLAHSTDNAPICRGQNVIQPPINPLDHPIHFHGVGEPEPVTTEPGVQPGESA